MASRKAKIDLTMSMRATVLYPGDAKFDMDYYLAVSRVSWTSRLQKY